MTLDSDDLARQVSYSVRRRKSETSADVVWNRISVTFSLFATALASAFVLGRK